MIISSKNRLILQVLRPTLIRSGISLMIFLPGFLQEFCPGLLQEFPRDSSRNAYQIFFPGFPPGFFQECIRDSFRNSFEIRLGLPPGFFQEFLHDSSRESSRNFPRGIPTRNSTAGIPAWKSFKGSSRAFTKKRFRTLSRNYQKNIQDFFLLPPGVSPGFAIEIPPGIPSEILPKISPGILSRILPVF